MPPDVLLHYLAKRGNMKDAFSLKCCINVLQNSTMVAA